MLVGAIPFLLTHLLDLRQNKEESGNGWRGDFSLGATQAWPRAALCGVPGGWLQKGYCFDMGLQSRAAQDGEQCPHPKGEGTGGDTCSQESLSEVLSLPPVLTDGCCMCL